MNTLPLIGFGPSIPDVAEFNRRALIALKGVSFGEGRGNDVVQTFRVQVERGAVSEKMQQAIYNVVTRYRKQITDEALLEYAAARAKGYAA